MLVPCRELPFAEIGLERSSSSARNEPGIDCLLYCNIDTPSACASNMSATPVKILGLSGSYGLTSKTG